jgi:hypothetical protein
LKRLLLKLEDLGFGRLIKGPFGISACFGLCWD